MPTFIHAIHTYIPKDKAHKYLTPGQAHIIPDKVGQLVLLHPGLGLGFKEGA
jgi:hypothetical protein